LALRTYQFPDLLGGAGRRLQFHFPDWDGTPAIIAAVTAELSFHDGFPEEVSVCEDAILLQWPGCLALYDSSGRRIDASALRRGAQPSTFVEAAERIEPPRRPARFDEPVVFLGRYFRHWGHLLTETTSRMWARLRHPELRALPAIFAGAAEVDTGDGATAELFRAFGELRLATQGGLRPPIRLRKAFVPAPTFVNRAHAYAGHAAVLRDAAARLLGGVSPRPDPRPVYFSRTLAAQPLRVFENEIELERALEARGFRIVHAERLDLRAQVEVVNAHRIFVGVAGSAMHNLFFALNGGEIVSHALTTTWAPQNHILTDAAIGAESHYACVCQHDDLVEDRFVLDVDAALAYLRDAGL
jgi:capsular polysaccharide biosynthesis protein